MTGLSCRVSDIGQLGEIKKTVIKVTFVCVCVCAHLALHIYIYIYPQCSIFFCTRSVIEKRERRHRYCVVRAETDH